MMFNQQNEDTKKQSNLQNDASSKLILIIEDDEVSASTLLQILSQERTYRVAHTLGGMVAWKFLQYIRPQLIILDYWLEDLNGIELYDRIQNNEDLRRVPILMLSAALPRDEVEKRGIVGMSKPFELDDLLATIDKLLAGE